MSVGNNRLKKQAIGLLIGLTLQYIFGMITTFFVEFPESGSEGQFWKVAWSNIPTAIHIIIAFGLLLGSLALMVRSFIKKDRMWKIVSVIGFVAILVAIYGGAQFVPTQKDIYSFIMSLAFIAAFITYGVGVYLDKE